VINLAKLILLDIVRNRFVFIYAAILLVITSMAFLLEDQSGKGLLSLLNLIMLIVPLVSVMFASSYLFNSYEFIELLLGQPVKRSKIWGSLYLGQSLAMSLAFLVGAGLPVLIFSANWVGLMMLLAGVLITMIFTALAMLSSALTREKAKGMGLSIMIWLFFALLFDGFILFILFQLSDYPVEKLVLILSFLNPIGLSRILILLHLDISALMGYAGAIFNDFFGTAGGMLCSLLALISWILFPFWFSLKIFKRKDI
jgi:Cu-processing system permease protein